MEKIRLILELPASAGRYTGLDGDERNDQIVDGIIEALDTPDVQVLDCVDETSDRWYRSERF